MLTQTTLRTKVRIIIDSLKDSKLKAFSFALQSLEIREPGASASSLLIFVLRLESFLVLFQKPVSIRGFSPHSCRTEFTGQVWRTATVNSEGTHNPTRSRKQRGKSTTNGLVFFGLVLAYKKSCLSSVSILMSDYISARNSLSYQILGQRIPTAYTVIRKGRKQRRMKRKGRRRRRYTAA